MYCILGKCRWISGDHTEIVCNVNYIIQFTIALYIIMCIHVIHLLEILYEFSNQRTASSCETYIGSYSLHIATIS